MRLTALGLALLTGCGPTSQGCPVDVEPTLELGVGTDDFTPIDDAEFAELVHGSQGGYHIDLAFRAEGLNTKQLVQATGTGAIEGQDLGSLTAWLQFKCEAPVAEAVAARLIFDAQPEDLDGRVVDIVVDLVDLDQTEFSASGSVLIEDPTL